MLKRSPIHHPDNNNNNNNNNNNAAQISSKNHHHYHSNGKQHQQQQNGNGKYDYDSKDKKVVFVGTFTAGGLEIGIKNGALEIIKEGRFPKVPGDEDEYIPLPES